MAAKTKRRTRRSTPQGTAAHPSQSILTIDLDALAANYRLLRSKIGQAACGAVVKADGYGLGGVRIAAALAATGCRDFFVAHLTEGREIRRAVPARANVIVLNGLLAGEERDFIAGDVIPALNDLEQIERWGVAARKAKRRLPAAVHFDTGMSRLGLPAEDAQRLIDEPQRLSGLDLRYVMSHLVVSEEPENPLNREQLARFQRIRAAFPKARASLANASGVFLGPDYHFDLVRPGAALYGINPLPGRPNPMRPVARLEGKVLQIHEVDPPASVGYGATHRVAGRTRIATIAAGYADGWPRSLSNRGSAYFGDVRLPVIGRVSMDLTTLDVSAVPGIKAGDTVELLGPHLSVDEVAEAAGTIGYEVLTRLGTRYHRTYLAGAGRR